VGKKLLKKVGVNLMQGASGLVRQIVEVCLNVQKGENIWIHSWDHTVDLASEIALACRRRGASPLVTFTSEDYWMSSIIETPTESLERIPDHQAAALERSNVFIFMLGPRNPIDWKRIPPEKQEFADVWYLGSNRFIGSWRKIAREHSIRMLGIEYCLVTPERARALSLKYDKWREVMLAGCTSDQQQITKKAIALLRSVEEGHEVSIETPFGTDISFRLVGRKPNSGDSILTHKDADEGIIKFLPSGFVEVAIDEDSAKGTIVYDVPILVPGGRKIVGLNLTFQRGKIVKYSAKSGIEGFDDYMRSTQGDFDKLGFFGIGLNPSLEPGYTQDDKVSGAVAIGIGGNEDKGGKNRTPGNKHWWASMTKATLKIDEDILLEQGKELYLKRQ
jgi:leucyl aminopeptidase (aminopeptidase T)